MRKLTIIVFALCISPLWACFQGNASGKVAATSCDTVRYKITRNVELPYRGGIDIETVAYDTIFFRAQGSSGYSGFERYIPLLQKGDLGLVLIPMDQGDIEYRFFLSTTKNNEMTDFDLYVEGEWDEWDLEPLEQYFEGEIDGPICDKELTNFVLFESEGDLYVTVTTTWDKHDYMGTGGVKTYRILDTGEIVETDTVKQP